MSIPDPTIAYQNEWLAIPTPFLLSSGVLSTAIFHDASESLPFRLRVACGNPTYYEQLRAMVFTVYIARNIESLPIEVAKLTKQHNLPQQVYGVSNTTEYKDFTIDVSNIVRTMLSHDLPSASTGTGGQDALTTFQISGEKYISTPQLLTPTTMNCCCVWVSAAPLIQNLGTGETLLNTTLDTGIVGGCMVFNTVNDNVNQGAIKTSNFRLGTGEYSKFLNKLKSNSITSIKHPILKKTITQRPKDEASLYGFWSKPFTNIGEYGFEYFFYDKSNTLLYKTQQFCDIDVLRSNSQFNPTPDDAINSAGRGIQLQVGLKSLMSHNSQLLAHVLNDNVGYYSVNCVRVSDGQRLSEIRYYNVETEKNIDNFVYADPLAGLSINVDFANSTQWTFVATAGTTKGFAISGGKLNSFSTSSDKQIVYNPNISLICGRLHKLKIQCNIVPNDDAALEIGHYDTFTNTFEPFGFNLPQDQDKGAGGLFDQIIYFTPPIALGATTNLAFRKTPNKTVHSMDNIELGILSKFNTLPRIEAYPDLRVFWLNRLGGMDYYDFKAEFKEDISIKRNIIHTEDDMLFDPKQSGRNSNAGGLHNIANVGQTQADIPYGYEYVEGNGSYTNNPFQEAGIVDQANAIQRFNQPHKRSKTALSSEIKRQYKLSTGEIPTWLAKDLEDLLTSNAVYIQRWETNDSEATYGHNYLEPVIMQDGTFNIIDEERKSVRFEITLESAKSFKTQHGI